MPTEVSLQLPAQDVMSSSELKPYIANVLGISPQKINGYQILKRSIDARRPQIFIQYKIRVFINEEYEDAFAFHPQLKNVENAVPVVIAGAGPAGLFAALRLIELGFKPIILERGKEVQHRRRDLAAMNKEGKVNSESNYCFGEGGAGTYSDGKLYTRSSKRGNILRALQWFVHFGAKSSILYDAHPHIGTNKLPQIIVNMRQQIVACGGEVRFNSKLTDFSTQFGSINAVEINGNEKIETQALILATGHSARDIFELLHHKQIDIQAKPFALGVRIEHPQSLINHIQYKCPVTPQLLETIGVASYSLVSQEAGHGVFSFCMCPGGIIAPASTDEGELVVNGWSPSKRDGQFANSGMVVTVDEALFAQYGFSGSLAGIQFQRMVEQKAWQAGGGKLKAPAQRMTDFVQNKYSSSLPECSYLPGVASAQISEVLPQEVSTPLQMAFKTFGKKMKGYFTADALICATESRTSSPVRIPRNNETLQHEQIAGLFPCGEGAGYAGGIISAAIDGENVANAVFQACRGKP